MDHVIGTTTPTKIKRTPEKIFTFRSVAGEFNRCRARSTIKERKRLPKNGTIAEIKQIAIILSGLSSDKSKKPGRMPI